MEDSSAQGRGHWARLRGPQRGRRATGQGAEHTLRTQPPAVQGEVRPAERVCAEGSGRAPHVLPGSPHSPAHAALEQGQAEPGPKGTATAVFTTQESRGQQA